MNTQIYEVASRNDEGRLSLHGKVDSRMSATVKARVLFTNRNTQQIIFTDTTGFIRAIIRRDGTYSLFAPQH